MEFKEGDKVKNNNNKTGIIQEVLTNGCFVNYGGCATYERNHDLRLIKSKKKYITIEEANKYAEREKQAEIQAQHLVKEFCNKLAEDTKNGR